MKRKSTTEIIDSKDASIEYWHTGNVRKITAHADKTGREMFRIYYDTPKTNQKLWGDGAHKNGKKVGCWQTYYFNGQLETFWKYRNGMLQDGVYPFYDESGKKIGENEYKNHKLVNGTVLLYWPDGTVRESYRVVNSKKV